MNHSQTQFLESDMDAPLRVFFEGAGFQVQSEVLHCDMVAVRDECCIVIELKQSLNMTVVLQACERQTRADEVYIAVPRPKKLGRGTRWSSIFRLLRRLELGLLFVAMETPVPSVSIAVFPEILVQRKQPAKRRSLLREVSLRSTDGNRAGSRGQPILTAYRERAIHIAVVIEHVGPTSPKQLRILGTSEKTPSILQSNVYGWFTRKERGIYDLTDAGRCALNTYESLANAYRHDARKHPI